MDPDVSHELNRWLHTLTADFRVVAPVPKAGMRSFVEIGSPSGQKGNVTATATAAEVPAAALGLTQSTTILPAKKFFLPPAETLLQFTDGRIESPAPDPRPLLLFGLHICELSADRLLTAIMAAGMADAPYLERRRRALTIGVTCRRTELCFCERTGHDRIDGARGDFDLFLDFGDAGPDGSAPVLVAGSGAGQELARTAPFPLEARAGEDRALAAPVPGNAKNPDTGPALGRWPLDLLPEMHRQAFGATMWDEVAFRCLGCGNCTVVCPLCYCFSTRDETGLDPARGQRLRLWDSCQLVAFARVAGGHNFREERPERIWYRFSHKFMRIQEGFGAPGCSGCGACLHFCPADIDPRQVIGSVLETAHA